MNAKSFMAYSKESRRVRYCPLREEYYEDFWIDPNDSPVRAIQR